MTNPNNAAQAAEPQTVLTDSEILAIGAMHGRPSLALLPMFRAFEGAVLSKLRAPVSSIREGFELTYAADADDPACAADLSHFTNGWRACVMSQVRAPVADERAAFKKCHSAIIKALASIAMADGPDTRKADDPELLYRSPVMDDVVRIRVALDECSAALASVPVAGEAQSDDTLKQVYDAFSIGEQARTPSILMANLGNAIRRSRCLSQVENVLSVPTPPEPEDDGLWGEESLLRWGADEKGYAEHFKAALAEWSRRTPVSEEPVYAYRRKGLDDFVTCDRERFDELSAKPHLFETRIFYAAPQASAEDVRNAALEEAAVLVGGHTWAGASKIVSDLIAEHIRALKQPQADKDSGQQRAAFDHPVFAFLLGEGPLHGVHFGDRHPSERGAYWWRKDLRAALSAPQAEQGERDAG